MAKYAKKPVVIEAYRANKEMIIHTLEGDMKASIGDYIITGVNGEQYPCKPDIFRKTYEPFETKVETKLTFGEMLEYLKQGRKCYRRGWNGKEQYIILGTAISYVNPDGYAVNANHTAMGSAAIVFVGTQGEQVGWLASQADILSNDWAIRPDDCEYNCCG